MAHNRGFISAQLLPPKPYGPFPSISGTAGSGAHWSFASLIPGNPAAAVPSLHGGYAFLVFLFVATLAWRRRGWKRWVPVGLAALYPLAQSFAVVYTANHYVVDLLIGFAFATAALLLVQRLWRRLGLPE
jgi:membrane-associated phospholipid phosphatase